MEIGLPVFWVLSVAVAAPLLAEIPIGMRVPVVVFEVVLGFVVGPHALGWLHPSPFIDMMFVMGMAASLFMAGMELDFGRISGRPLVLAVAGWGASLAIAAAATAVLQAVPGVHAPMMVTLILCTTALGTLLPVLRDSGALETSFGRMFVAAGTVGEVAPIVVMSVLLSQRYSTWQEIGFLAAFLGIVFSAAAIGIGARPPRVLALLSRTMHASTQLPVRIAFLLVAALFVLSEQFGFESILGAFAAGMIIGLASRSKDGAPMRAKIDAVFFGWFMPFFFVGTGIRFDLFALVRDLKTILLVVGFLLLFVIVRGLPVLLYRNELAREERLPFALYSSVASLSLVVVITGLGVRAHVMSHEIANALIGAAMLSLLLFPTIAGGLLSRRPPAPDAAIPEPETPP